jgi:hypothetical protein
MEGKISGVDIRDLAQIYAREPFAVRYPPPGLKALDTIFVVSHRNATPCMRYGENSYEREPNYKQVPAEVIDHRKR